MRPEETWDWGEKEAQMVPWLGVGCWDGCRGYRLGGDALREEGHGGKWEGVVLETGHHRPLEKAPRVHLEARCAAGRGCTDLGQVRNSRGREPHPRRGEERGLGGSLSESASEKEEAEAQGKLQGRTQQGLRPQEQSQGLGTVQPHVPLLGPPSQHRFICTPTWGF